MSKSISEGKEAVIELQDHNGVMIAQSEFITAGGQPERLDPRAIPLSAFEVGEMRPFKVRFPYIQAITDYQVVVKLVDATPWRFKQHGTYAQEDGPFDITLYTIHPLSEPVKQGSTF